jgi:hypothetical protein
LEHKVNIPHPFSGEMVSKYTITAILDYILVDFMMIQITIILQLINVLN